MERDSKLLKEEVYDQDLCRRASAYVVPARASGDRVRHVRLHPALPGDRHGRRWRRRRVTGTSACSTSPRGVAAVKNNTRPSLTLIALAMLCLLLLAGATAAQNPDYHRPLGNDPS